MGTYDVHGLFLGLTKMKDLPQSLPFDRFPQGPSKCQRECSETVESKLTSRSRQICRPDEVVIQVIREDGSQVITNRE